MIATIGFFDGVHLGHCFLLEQVMQEARSRLMPAGVITFRQHPQQIIHPESPLQLLTTPQEKQQKIKETGIDQIVLLDFTKELSELSAKEFMLFLHDKHGIKGLVIGYDHRFGHDRKEGFEQYKAYGTELGMEIIQAKVYCERSSSVSSSVIRQALTAGNIQTANHLLGYRYTIEGVVVNGYHVGRQLGFPTANIRPTFDRKLIPADGVYAIRAFIDDDKESWEGMMSIGHRPTLQNSNEQSLEVHFFDFSHDIYGHKIRVELYAKTRDEKKFDSLGELANQLTLDKIEILTYFKQHKD